MAAAAIRILFNQERPSCPISPAAVATRTSAAPRAAVSGGDTTGAVGEFDRMGLPGLQTRNREEDEAAAATAAAEREQAGDGLMWEEEDGAFDDEDLRQALAWMKQAAASGHAAAQRSLGHCYLRTYGVAHDEKAGVAWIARAAKSGDGGAQVCVCV